MKVLAVLNYKKYVVLDVPDVVEPEVDQSRKPDWDARQRIVALADEKSEGIVPEWTYSDYYLEANAEEVKEGYTQEIDGFVFSNTEWFDI